MTVEPTLADFFPADERPRTPLPGTLGKIAELLKRNDIAVEDIGRVQQIRINEWQMGSKDADGNPQITDLESKQIVLSPRWADGPEWPVVQQAAGTTIRYAPPSRRATGGRITVLLPDPQFGYLRYDDGTLDPMHDEKAIDVTLALIATVRPDVIINLGDFLDASEWSSKFVVHPEYVLTTQPAIDAGHTYLARQRAQAGRDCEIKLLGGNHDDRIGLAVTRNAMAALRLRQACKPESWPVLSVPYLLRLDDLDVEYVGAYPAGRIKVADRHRGQTPLYALHGEKLDVAKVAKSQRQSYIQGHAHHVALHTETYEVDGEPEQVQAWSLGCLCRLDGAVPSTKGGIDDRGRPYKRWESWQHAAAVVTETDDGWWVEPVFIHDGVAMYRGVRLAA